MTACWVRPLTAAHCAALAPHVSEEDRLDLVAHGHDPESALATALGEPGEAWAAGVSEDHVLGAFGWTEAGAIWSMWRPLTRGEALTLLKLAPRFIRAIVTDSGGRRLGNIVCVDNERIISWLRATECFEFLVDKALTYGDRTYVPFVVSPQLTGAPSHV